LVKKNKKPGVLPAQLFTFVIPIYECQFVFCVGKSNLEGLIKRNPSIIEFQTALEECDEYTGGYTLNSPNCILMYFPQDISSDLPSLLYYVSHEIFHAVSTLMFDRGAKYIDGEGNEPHAYLTGWLTREIFRNVKLC